MKNFWARRDFLKLASMAPLTVVPTRANETSRFLNALSTNSDPPESNPFKEARVNDQFPTQPAELAREIVTVSHFDLKRVKELVEGRPSLARAAWDWGFGDWESALGAASHMGNRPIAEYLLSKGAVPTLFSATMLGQLELVKAFIAAQPGAQRLRGPHSISLLAHAKFGKEAARPVYEYLQSLGDADADAPVPLSESDAASIKGAYVFGVGVSEQVEVTVEQGQATWTRKATMGRPLTHLGDRVFYPCGAPAVRIRFADDAGTTLMTVTDPEPVLVVRRKQQA